MHAFRIHRGQTRTYFNSEYVFPYGSSSTFSHENFIRNGLLPQSSADADTNWRRRDPASGVKRKVETLMNDASSNRGSTHSYRRRSNQQ
uniref:Uncharacterized protein n=1 Tax=Panagrolaimus sp. ES5 TaxID=591445 RepID=A0AC34F9F2_9BILA